MKKQLAVLLAGTMAMTALVGAVPAMAEGVELNVTTTFAGEDGNGAGSCSCAVYSELEAALCRLLLGVESGYSFGSTARSELGQTQDKFSFGEHDAAACCCFGERHEPHDCGCF